MTAFSTPEIRCETIAALVAAHPKLFGEQFPSKFSPVPKGWYKLLHELCDMLEKACSDSEIAELEFGEIAEKSGALILDFGFHCHLSSEQIRLIEARVFSIRNRSTVSCIECGKIVETLPERSGKMLCKKHARIEQSHSLR